MIGENSEGRGREREREEGTSWSWYLFNFMLQDSIFSGKPTRHMFEFSFLNCKVKYMLFWILSPNICLVFSTHLLCSSRSIKVLVFLDAVQAFSGMPSGVLKRPPGGWNFGLGKNGRMDLGRRWQKVWRGQRKAAGCQGPRLLSTTDPLCGLG